MDSQNLFSYTVRPDREDKNRSTDVFDLNAYTVRTLSPDLKAEKDGLYDRWLEVWKARKKRENTEYWIANLLAFFLVIALAVFIALFFDPDSQIRTMIDRLDIVFTLLLLWFDHLLVKAFTPIIRRLYIRKHPESTKNESDFDPRLSETVTAARAELGIPEEFVWTLDILPYRHIQGKGGESREFRPRGIYDNIPVAVWQEEQVLYLSDEDTVMRLPLSKLAEVKRIKGWVKFRYWLKSADYDQEPYKEGNVLCWSSSSSLSCYSKIKITLRDGSYLLIPGYDAETLRHILGEGYSF